MSSSGKYRQQFRVLTPIVEDDGEGGQIVTEWRPGLTIWGEKIPTTSREQALAGALQNVVTHYVYTHYVHGDAITTEKRLRQTYPRGPDLQIVGMRDSDQRSKELQLDCSEALDANS